VTVFKGPWFRSHAVTRGPVYFGRNGRFRFDAPGRDYGVLYVARRPAGAFIETFGHDTGRDRVLDLQELHDRGLSRIEVLRPLRLVDLRSEGLARLGADAELLTGAYGLSQAWSKALHDHRAAVDGIAYRARHDPSQTCAALFERAAAALGPPVLLGPFASAALRATLVDILDRYEYGIV
jgi:hypothetical protein